MPRTQIRAGVELEIPDRAEHREDIAGELARYDVHLRASVRAMKYMRFPQLSAVPSGSAVTIGGDQFPVVTPEQGYVWAIRLISVNGLTSGATPDIVNLKINGFTWWQFNGNNFAYTFGKTELMVLPGETMQFVNQGTIAATSAISVRGAMLEVPAERVGELF